MKSKLTPAGLVAMVAILFFMVVTGLAFKVIAGILIIKALWFMLKIESNVDDSDKLKKDKPKIPRQLADKLAKRKQ